MSAITKLQAANDLVRLGIQFRALISIAEELKDVGSLEQAKEEQQRLLEEANAALAEVKAKIEAAKGALSDVHHSCDLATADLHDTKKHAADLIDQAKTTAGQIVADGHARAEGIERAAKSEVDRIKAVAEALKAENASFTKQIAEQNHQLSVVKEAVRSLTERKYKLEQGLAALNHLGVG